MTFLGLSKLRNALLLVAVIAVVLAIVDGASSRRLVYWTVAIAAGLGQLAVSAFVARLMSLRNAGPRSRELMTRLRGGGTSVAELRKRADTDPAVAAEYIALLQMMIQSYREIARPRRVMWWTAASPDLTAQIPEMERQVQRLQTMHGLSAV